MPKTAIQSIERNTQLRGAVAAAPVQIPRNFGPVTTIGIDILLSPEQFNLPGNSVKFSLYVGDNPSPVNGNWQHAGTGVWYHPSDEQPSLRTDIAPGDRDKMAGKWLRANVVGRLEVGAEIVFE